MRRLEQGDSRFAAYNIESAVPFTDADGVELRKDPLAVVTRHRPDAAKLLARLGPRAWNDPQEPGGALTPIHEVFEIGRARRDLGWEPQHNFDEFLSELRDRSARANPLVPSAAQTVR